MTTTTNNKKKDPMNKQSLKRLSERICTDYADWHHLLDHSWHSGVPSNFSITQSSGKALFSGTPNDPSCWFSREMMVYSIYYCNILGNSKLQFITILSFCCPHLAQGIHRNIQVWVKNVFTILCTALSGLLMTFLALTKLKHLHFWNKGVV